MAWNSCARRLGRKYGALEEEYKELKENYVNLDKDYSEREQKLIERICFLQSFKKQSTLYLKMLLEEAKKSVPKDKFDEVNDLRQVYADEKANLEIKLAHYITKVSKLESAERDLSEEQEKVQLKDEEIIDLNMEMELIKKRLEDVDIYFRKYQQSFRKLANYFITNNISPLQGFQQMDTNKNGRIGKDELIRVRSPPHTHIHAPAQHTPRNVCHAWRLPAGARSGRALAGSVWFCSLLMGRGSFLKGLISHARDRG